jgi:hypothetical protein
MGKFDSALDRAVYGVTLHGMVDDEVGSSSESPGLWAGMMTDGKGIAEAIVSLEESEGVTPADYEYLETDGKAGVILTESSDGFVDVKYYAKKSDLDADWEECLEELNLPDDDEGDEFEENHAHSATAWSRDSDKWFDEVASGWKKYQHDGGWRELHRIAGMSPTRPNFELFKKKAGGRLPSLTAFLEKMESGAYKDEFKAFAGTSRAAYGPRSISQVSSLFDLFRQATEYSGNGSRGVRHDGKAARGMSGDPKSWPKPKFRMGAAVTVDGRPGEISYIGGYDEFIDGYRYKVKFADGSRIFHNEASIRRAGGKHQKNASRPELESSGVLDQLIDMQAESLEPSGGGHVPREVKNEIEVTDDLREVVSQYEDALREALEEVVEKFPPEDDATAGDLYNDEAPYLVLMTLMGHGVGIWDGSWDSHYPDRDTVRAVGDLLKQKLGKYANDAGTGWIIEELETAVYEAMRRANYGFDEETYVPLEEGEDAGFEFSDTEIPPDRIAVIVDANGLPLDKFWDAAGGERAMTRGEVDRVVSKLGGKFARPYRKNPQARWHVFLNGELLDTVYFDQDMDADQVKRALVNHDGFSDRIVVQQPPARRSSLPGHYRQGDHRANGATGPFPAGALILLQYGNGTQAARVLEVTSRGGYKIERFRGPWGGARGRWTRAGATLRADDPRILGELPPTDRRRTEPGFKREEP